MSVSTAALRVRHRLHIHIPMWLTEIAFMFVAAIGLGIAFRIDDFIVRILLAVVVGGLLVVFAFVDPALAIPAGIAFLICLGTVRREVSFIFGQDVPTDPLLVVIPLISAALFLVAYRHGAMRNLTKLSKVVMGFTVVALLGALNPLQGAVTAAPLGLAIFLPPVLWFWIARALVDDVVMARVYRTVLVLTLLAGVYGLIQSLNYFTAFDRFWFENLGDQYVSIRVGHGVVRPFGFSSSAAEYGKLLAMGLVIIAAIMLYRRSLLWFAGLGAIGFLLVDLVLSALRTTLVLAVAAIGLMYGVRKRVSFARLAIFGLIAIIVLLGLITLLVPGGRSIGRGPTSASNAAVLSDRALGGLSDPLSSGDSTLGTHIALIERALVGLVPRPLGLGTASITLAGKRYGASQSGDQDMADAAIAFGIVGVVLYVLLIVRLIQRCMEVARIRQDWLALAALGVVAVTGLQWLNGGLYVATFLAWFTFGWLDRDHAAIVAGTSDGGPLGAVADQPAVENTGPAPRAVGSGTGSRNGARRSLPAPA